MKRILHISLVILGLLVAGLIVGGPGYIDDALAVVLGEAKPGADETATKAEPASRVDPSSKKFETLKVGERELRATTGDEPGSHDDGPKRRRPKAVKVGDSVIRARGEVIDEPESVEKRGKQNVRKDYREKRRDNKGMSGLNPEAIERLLKTISGESLPKEPVRKE